jgi:hypothetical protein
MGRGWIRRLRVLYDCNYRPAMSNNVRLLGRLWLCNRKGGGVGRSRHTLPLPKAKTALGTFVGAGSKVTGQ